MNYILTIAPWQGDNDNYVFAFPPEFKARIEKEKWPIKGELKLPEGIQPVFICRESGRHERYEKGLPIDLVTETFPELSPGEIAKFQQIASERGFIFGETQIQNQRKANIVFYRRPDKTSTLYGVKKGTTIETIRRRDLCPGIEEALKTEPMGTVEAPFRTLRFRLERLICDSMHEKADVSPAIVFPTESKYNHFTFNLGQYNAKS